MACPSEWTVADVERRLERFREALEAGAAPSVVSRWIRDAMAERARAERLIDDHSPAHPPVTIQDVRVLVNELGDLVRVIDQADP